MADSRVQLPVKTDPADSAGTVTPKRSSHKALEAALDLVRPAVQDDGGDVEVASFENGTVTIRFLGACVSCPSREMTLRHGIESHLIQQVPGVEKVIAEGD